MLGHKKGPVPYKSHFNRYEQEQNLSSLTGCRSKDQIKLRLEPRQVTKGVHSLQSPILTSTSRTKIDLVNVDGEWHT